MIRLLPGSAILFLAACSTVEPGGFTRPSSGDVEGTLVSTSGHHSPWRFRVDTPDGQWMLECAYHATSDHEQFTAFITFPDGKKLTLPAEPVSAACAAISEQPYVSSWPNPDGTHTLAIGGFITTNRSEGQFRFNGRDFLGATVWEENSPVANRKPSPLTERKYDATGNPITP